MTSSSRTVRLCVLADVHADVLALEGALAQAERLGCTSVVCAGDLVGYGLFPEETIGLLQERRVQCVRGNHDRWAIGRGRPDAPDDVEVDAYDASGWDLSPEAIRFLAALPASRTATIEGVRVAVHHGSPPPGSDMVGVYFDGLTPGSSHGREGACGLGTQADSRRAPSARGRRKS